ncbi:hypothetical protein [Salinivirga cyanobacteriivorans]|uniref:Uncharacterized protein n=1 Tax=Salinivirga cyanobacteriivorans TaxID=1307839 RepID=A0A0S2HY82_9BACT|nr:hypothetical protein [Salinivirga cyanobacteriivorans]ALO14948.1 hypothetical protein L21SP5_01294 [Salinivirga cyanobacteriivorans]
MRSYIIFLFLILGVLTVRAQRCDDKDFCDKDLYGEYDYRSQSNYAQVYTGDTVRVKVVVYSGQNYRIFTCAERRLKDVFFRVIYPEKRFKRAFKEIKKKQVPIYEKDKDGNFLYDENGDRIKTGTIFANDTVWGRDLVTSESVVYDSREAEEPYWEASIHKTRLIIIESIIPPFRKKRNGCIQIMVGRKYKNASQFRR